MSFALTGEQIRFFKIHRYICFENLISTSTALELKEHLSEALAKRLGIPVGRLSKQPTKQLFTSGYDLHLIDDRIRKVSHKLKLASVAQELFKEPLVRFGFSHYLMTTTDPTPPYDDLPLQQTSCLSPLAGILILNLGEFHPFLSLFSLPQEPGSGLFLSPSHPFPYQALFQMPGVHLLMIGYAKERTLFRTDTEDPLASELKKLGYVFNEQLKDPLHPLLQRQ